MKQRDYNIAKELKKRLSEDIQLVDFRIFGSRVRGDSDEYSDMDIFLEVNSIDKALKEKIFNTVWEVGFKHFIFISSLIFTRDEIEKSPLKASPILKNIITEGVRI